MRKRRILAMACTFIAIFALLLIGCDNDTPSIPNGGGASVSNEVFSGLTIPVQLGVIPETTRIVVEDTLVDLADNPIRSFITEYTPATGETTFTHNLSFYGRHLLKISYHSNESLLYTVSTKVTETAEEYNIAPMIATVPTLYFTLLDADLDATTKREYIDPTIPTIVMLERQDAYNWQELPSNMSSCPFLSDEQVEHGTGGGTASFDDIFWKYIAYLYELNPQSRFNFFGNDYWQGQMFELLDIGIPLDQLSFVFFSDGRGTFAAFRDIFGDGTGQDNSEGTFERLASKWNEIKQKHAAGNPDYRAVIGDDYINARGYMTVLVNDPEVNAYWIVSRKNADVFGSSSVFNDKVMNNGRVLALNMNDLFNALSAQEQDAFKNLFAFDDSTIENTGRPVLIFLGTRTDLETDLESYIIAVQSMFGDEFDCYYKGHPGHVFNNPEERERILSETGMKTLDAAIPAELFAFYLDDAVYAGYTSSTFKNIDNRCVMLTFYGTRAAEEADIADYADRVENYIEKIGDSQFRIVKDCMKENPQTAIWDGASALSSLEWEPYSV